MTYRHVKDGWNDAVADQLTPLDRLVYRSNLLGSDWRITNTGGGNTSSKLMETDPVTGEEVEVLWVKGSGGDLRTAKRANFSSLYQDKLISLQQVYDSFDEKGPKTPAEDAMVGMYKHCTFNLNPRAPSIDTPLHSFVPFKFVDHTHPVSCIAIATAADGPELTKEIFGDDVIWVDWLRPGFELGLKLQEVCEKYPNAKGVILGAHGLINWADDDKECYYLSLDLIEKAAIFLEERMSGIKIFGGARYQTLNESRRAEVLSEMLPWLRGEVSRDQKMIGTVQTDEDTLEFVNSVDAPRLAELGTSCPDHFLRTKIKPLFADWNPASGDLGSLKKLLAAGIEQYRSDYADYYEQCKHENSPARRQSNPTVVLIPGIGMITWGKTKSESRVTAEFFKAATAVMRYSDTVSTYQALPRQEAFDIEYWLLEEAKLKRMPPEKELSREIVAVVGAGSGIGKEVVERLLVEGATVAALDVKRESAEETARDNIARIGMGIGIAGSGISGSGDVVGIGVDITDRASVRHALNQIVLAYGGLDSVVVTAGLYVSPDTNGHIPDQGWSDSFAVNTIGPYVVADEAKKIWKKQDLEGALVITTSVNGVVAKRGSFAYDASKAATNHLVRELAIDLAPRIRVNAVAPATVVAGSSMFPRDRVMASLSKYGLEYSEDEETEALRDRLAGFYAERTLTKKPITPQDQAEAIFLLVSDRLGKTTGQVIAVDGGLTEAFLR
ncbi:MAG TPA: bifunctional rhamnulose-1-phosphate aldolase/short-chain dehydrogenase [Rhodothermales bacterium]|nr:bifunctional rhamnulose-1-phosphate aldolase/short-chain dehydrogenase [Rhodothermales bacterium]